MGKKSRSGSSMNILDHISESLETIFWVKILKFFDADADPGSENLIDPGSGMEKIRIWYPGEQPGSATLEVRYQPIISVLVRLYFFKISCPYSSVW
jgi:hypothetical protein